MAKLVECVPNVSEGRRLDIVQQILAEVRGVPGVALLDCASNADHNRSVITFLGGTGRGTGGGLAPGSESG